VPFLRAPAFPDLSAIGGRRCARVLALGAALALCTPAFALDLLEAYRAAMANDAQLASARAQFAAARELVPQARAALLPQIGAGIGIDQQWIDTNVAPSRDYRAQSYGVELSYPLFRLQNLELLEQSRLQASLGEAQYREAQQSLIVRVAEAYFDVLAAQDSVATIDAQKRAIAEQLASAKRNFEVGTATITDQQEAQARYDLTLAQEFAATSELELRRAALAQLVGQPIGELEGLRPGLQLEGPEPARESDWVEGARRDSYPVQQAALSSEIARREIDLQRYARYPTVDLTSSVAHTRNSQASLVGVRSNSATIGVELAVPIYTGGAISARVRQAAATHERALADLETTRRGSEQAARQAFLGLTSGLAQVRALEAAERSSQLALESNLLGYQVGVRINIDVLNAQQQLFTTRRDLARARYDVLVNGLRLKETGGTLEEDDLLRVDSLLAPPSPSDPNPATRAEAPGRPAARMKVSAGPANKKPAAQTRAVATVTTVSVPTAAVPTTSVPTAALPTADSSLALSPLERAAKLSPAPQILPTSEARKRTKRPAQSQAQVLAKTAPTLALDASSDALSPERIRRLRVGSR
jgi:outer membrane protein